ncbi:hypothetical protein Moror_15021 [Moniliophthora roreri MCA 2997]|uniref:Uncharacterized protein n=1 Tax=Moniliophthora roreri (strain MCA 2997) TaxID=1381753 RepID=V2WSG6_MONRO|nr:hypothetical protein Moror_15021 [Moniliophthora roreri MCA 2997]
MARFKPARSPSVESTPSSHSRSESSPSPHKRLRTCISQNTPSRMASNASTTRYHDPKRLRKPVASNSSSLTSARPFVDQSRMESLLPPSPLQTFSDYMAPPRNQLNLPRRDSATLATMSEPRDDEVQTVKDGERRKLGEQLRNGINALSQPRPRIAKQLEIHKDIEERENILPFTPTTQIFRFGASAYRVDGTNARNPTTPPGPSPTIVASPHKKISTAFPGSSTDFLKTYIPLKSTVIDGVTYSVGDYINVDESSSSDAEVVKIHAIGKDRTPRSQRVHLSVYGMYPREAVLQLLEDGGSEVNYDTLEILQSLGKTELVLTNRNFVIPANDVLEHARLEIFRDNHCDQQPFRDSAPFNRFTISFSGFTTTIHPTDYPEQMCPQCPQCNLVYDPVETVQRFCDRCKCWFHEGCLEQHSSSTGMKQTGDDIHNVDVVAQYPIICGLARCPPEWGLVGNGRLMRMIRAWSSAPEDRPRLWTLALGKELSQGGDRNSCAKLGRDFMAFMLTSKRNGLLLAMACPNCNRRI